MIDQQLILVDDYDNFLGEYASKEACHFGSGLHHRAFTVMLLNQKKEVLLQNRKHRLWDLTNSHPIHKSDGGDETYEQAIKKCLNREWGIKVFVNKIFGFNYYAPLGNHCENEYCAFFAGEHNGKVFPNPEVAYGYKWIPIKELVEEIKKKSRGFTPWAVRTIENYIKEPFLKEFFE